MKATINQDIKTCEVCGHQGTDVHRWPTYKNNHDTTEYQCDDFEVCLTRKHTHRQKVQWLVDRCSCGREYQYPKGGYHPKTCGDYDCVHKSLHPELQKDFNSPLTIPHKGN